MMRNGYAIVVHVILETFLFKLKYIEHKKAD